MLEVTFEETYGESREISITNQGISQTIVAVIHGNFMEEAGIGQGGLYADDVLVMQAAYQYMPLFYQLPSYENVGVTLIIQDIKLKQINESTWKITATYDVPRDGGRKGGGMGTNEVPIPQPDDDEEDPGNFTQISVNLSASTRHVDYSNIVLSCKRSINIPPGEVPYAVGKPAPIGHTNEGIKGADVYAREFGFSITSYFPPEKLKYSYVRRLARLQGSLNDKRFYGFNIGEVLFLEAEFTGDIYQVVPVTFHFKQRNNFYFSETDITKLADPEVEGSVDRYYEPDFPDSNVVSGWAEVDYRYAPVPDTVAVMVVQRPILRIIHLNYEYSDFTKLEI
jgi:hypothetical protein